jgi:exoribonuclease R
MMYVCVCGVTDVLVVRQVQGMVQGAKEEGEVRAGALEEQVKQLQEQLEAAHRQAGEATERIRAHSEGASAEAQGLR